MPEKGAANVHECTHGKDWQQYVIQYKACIPTRLSVCLENVSSRLLVCLVR